MGDFLAQYSMREKAIVVAALLVGIGLSIHAFVIEPYQHRFAEIEAQIVQQRSDLGWMRSAVARLPRAGAVSNNVEIRGTLANFVNQAVRRQGLSQQLAQITPVGNDEIRMRYSAVDFNRLLKFVAQINTGGLKIKDVRITAADDPGKVDSSLVLIR